MISVVSVAVRVFLGLSLIGRPGFRLFESYVDPRACRIVVVNRPGGHIETGHPGSPAGIRMVQVVDANGRGPSCSVCRGYRP